MPRAAAIIIGNEILSGRCRDENGYWLAGRLRSLGIDLVEIAIVPDEIEPIAAAVRRLGPTVDALLAAGGVGPTHDDRTMEAIAAAYGVPLVRHARLLDVIRTVMKDRFTDAAARMADLPEGAELWWDGDFFFPLVVMRNTCVFPGVPQLLQRKFDAVAHRLPCGRPVATRQVTVAEHEAAIADALRHLQERWPAVSIGSYPQFARNPWTVTLVIEGRDAEAVTACEAELRALVAERIVEEEGE